MRTFEDSPSANKIYEKTEIKMNKSERIGKNNKMNCGMQATIIAYRSAIDMDIQFEDGYIAMHVPYSSFKKGCVANKNIKISQYKANKHIGETVQAKCGLQMELITYKNGKDIDIRFEDGVIVNGVSYYNFCKGSVEHPRINKALYQAKRTVNTNRVGEETVNNDGESMCIIKYRSSRDIDVQFSDGTVATHRKYDEFVHHQIKNPNHIKNKHVGEKSKCNNGLFATISNYYSYNDVTVIFEDGHVKEHVRYEELKKGSVGHPNYIRKNGNVLNGTTVIEAFKHKRLGEEKLMRCGLIGKVTRYNGVRDITVEFPNGQEKITDWKSFSSGNVKPDGVQDVRLIENKKKRTGMKATATNGLSMTVIKYNTATDMTVKFENGYIKEHVTWDCFISGNVSCPTVASRRNVSLNEYCVMYYLKPYGFVHYTDKKHRFEIDILHREKGVGVEYDGQTFHGKKRLKTDINKNRDCDKKGITLYRIREPECPIIDGNVIKRTSADCFCEDLSESIKALISILNQEHGFDITADVDVVRDRNIIAQSYGEEYSIIGEKSISNAGDTMKIIAFRNHKDIDIEFEDGTIVEHKAYSAFKKGQIGNPNHYKKERKGQKRRMNNGMSCTIIDYMDSQNITVMFEDGTVISDRQYSNFVLGNISHPKISSQSIQAKRQVKQFALKRIGQTATHKNGKKMKIIAYRKAIDIDILFEDGRIINTTYAYFKKYAIA